MHTATGVVRPTFRKRQGRRNNVWNSKARAICFFQPEWHVIFATKFVFDCRPWRQGQIHRELFDLNKHVFFRFMTLWLVFCCFLIVDQDQSIDSISSMLHVSKSVCKMDFFYRKALDFFQNLASSCLHNTLRNDLRRQKMYYSKCTIVLSDMLFFLIQECNVWNFWICTISVWEGLKFSTIVATIIVQKSGTTNFGDDAVGMHLTPI